MLRFFSRIRYQLAAQNHVAKYMRYAIGEILLVVIGILIALQINNWNTNKRETVELHNYLRNIKNNIQDDLLDLEKIKAHRDSSRIFSQNFLRIAKQSFITNDDFNLIIDSKYNVYYDQYFRARTSGFEALKNSGFIGKLNGTILESKINEYYYTVDKISEREKSLNNTIESLEIIAFTESYQYKMEEIQNNAKYDTTYFFKHQKEIKEALNTPSTIGANLRNRSLSKFMQYYAMIEELSNELISEIDKFTQEIDL